MDMWIDILVLVLGFIFEFVGALVVYRLAGFKVHRFDIIAFGLALLCAAWMIVLVIEIVDEGTLLVGGLGRQVCEIVAVLLILKGYKKYKNIKEI